ncbi:oxidoreductase, SDR family [Geotalea daltonii FRC-32]|uniref:Oxidoreductase, SDR family n=1 Tax=Geotalea daltonii (strain DSM 22248 / JCM 15807 / FRC-32) TaxID=316067 RepID=B9M1S7_GEODF|nr:SDR family oxidoreductase [Geotalea daltonii]ACM19223.1 oxidoreductase, SDR family [Geotalea daltonii FRC-32]
MKPGGTKRTVVITGASAGVGRATARAFAREGARIGLLARDQERLEAVRQEVEERGGEAIILVADVADADQVELAAARVEEQFGPIDVWVNNAMVSVFSAFKDMTSDEFRRVTEVTYLGVVYGTSAAMSRMIPRNRGTVIQVGSALAERSIPLQSAYCGAKHAIRGFTDSIRCELIHDRSKVHITMVQLPAMNTPQFNWTKSRMPFKPQPVPPIFQPEVAADAIVWSSHHRRRELYVGMPTVKAMWGNKFIAGILDLYLAKKGYSGQQTDELEERDRPNNMWHPVEGDFSAHGRFDAQASYQCDQLWLAKNKWLGLGLLATGISTALALSMKSRFQE